MSRDQLSPLFTWRSAITESGLPPTVRLVALALSLHMSERGDSCFPARQTLADETGLSVRSVDKAIKQLEEAKYLVVDRPAKTKGRGHMNTYRATVPSAREEGRTRFALRSGRANLATRKGEPRSPESVIEGVSIPESSNPTGSRSLARPARERDPVWEILFTLETGEPYSTAARRKLTRKAADRLNAAAAEIRATGTSPEDLQAAIAAWPRVFPRATATAHAVASHLPRLLAASRGVIFAGPAEDSADEIARRAEALYARRRAEEAAAYG
jgi:hypothetical protein